MNRSRRSVIKAVAGVAAIGAVGVAATKPYTPPVLKGTKEWPAQSAVFRAWLHDHGIDPKSVYHIDIAIDVSESPTVTVYRYQRNADGHLFVDPATGDAAREEPETLTIVSMPDMLYAMT